MDFLDEIRQKIATGKVALKEIKSLPARPETEKATFARLIPQITEIDSSYSVILTEEQDHPFCITPEGLKLAQRITERIRSDSAKAQAIFNWLEKNVQYDKHFSGRKGYHTAKEVMEKGKGVCGETAYLFIVLARAAGLKANWVKVTIDYSGKKVNHACAIVYCTSKEILVDVAYHQFDAKHGKYRVLSDQEAVEHFQAVSEI